jgi:hypothetical protein
MASIQLKDLVPGKNYKVKVRAKFKGEDPGKWSKILNFKAPIKSKTDDDVLIIKYGAVVGDPKSDSPQRGFLKSSNFNGGINVKTGLNTNNLGTAGWAIDWKGVGVFNSLYARGKIVAGDNPEIQIGENVDGTKDGIKIDDANFWYRAQSSMSNSTEVFKVGLDLDGRANKEFFSITKGGNVEFQGGTNPTRGIIKGLLTIRLDKNDAVDKFIIGQNVRNTDEDGILLNTHNYWTIANNNKAAFFKVGDANEYLLFNSATGKMTLKGDLSIVNGSAGGVFIDNAGRIYSGRTAYSGVNNKGWYFEYNNGDPRFFIGDNTNYIRWNGSGIDLRGGSIKTSDSNSYILFDANKIEGVYNPTGSSPTTTFRIDINGNAEFKGKVKGGSKIENSTTIGDSQVGGSPIEVTTATPTAVGDPTSIPTSMGLKVGQSIFITGDLNNGNISLLRNRNGINDFVGGIIDSKTSKYADTSSGIGMLIGLSTGFPFVEVGYDTYNTSTGARTGPRIRLMGSSTAYVTINASNFGLVGGPSSFIDVPDGTAPDKYLTKKNGYLIWAPPPSGGSGTTTTLELGPNLASNLLGLSLSESEYTLTLDGQDANLVFAGPTSGATTAPTFRSLISNDIIGALTAGTGITFTNSNNKITISSTAATGYTNGIAPGTANKITYSNAAPPGTGRTNGDIHFVL